MEMSILHAIQSIHTSLLDSIMVFITTLGNGGLIWIAIAVICLFSKKYRKCGIAMGLALLLSFILGNVILKNLVARPRPCWIDSSVTLLIKNPSDYSFPSGHSFASFAGATVIFLYYKRAGIMALTVAALIAFSRLYLFVHYPSDVLVGTILGIFVAVASVWIVNKYLSNKREGFKR